MITRLCGCFHQMITRLCGCFHNCSPVAFLLPVVIYLILLVVYNLQDGLLSKGWTDINCKNPVPPHLFTGGETYSSKNLSHEITFVTAYFNIGTFQKGPYKTFSTNTYYSWMKNYAYINNSIILYTDLVELAIKFRRTRSHFPESMTVIYLVVQEDFWAFKLKPKIKAIYDQPGYPQHLPNTVFPPYSCAMHAKYDVIEKVIKERLLKTKYLAWMDIGYFRGKEKEIFTMHPPEDIKDDHIAFLQIHGFRSDVTPKKIIYDNLLFLAGGIFIGRPEYLLPFVEDYREAVYQLIEMKLMNTDQQVLYSMYSIHKDFKPRIPIQRYYSINRLWWFFLGDLCREKSLTMTREKKKMQNLVANNLH